jgi:hypothetical protein
LTASPKAKLIALACSKPPKGRKRWTLQLLDERTPPARLVLDDNMRLAGTVQE